MALHPTATRLWRHLRPDERLAATTAFFSEPPTELIGSAVTALAQARHMRPQAARSLAPEAQARILATVHDPGEPLAQGLLVALHLAARRPLLVAFLDALGLAHENGVLKDEEAGPPPTAEQARNAVAALGSFPREEVLVYLNTLWLQDPERWAGLEAAPDWLAA